HIAEVDVLIEKLGDIAGPDRAEMKDLGSEMREDRLGARDIGAVAADHESQRAVLRRRDAIAHGAIEIAGVAAREFARQLATERRSNGARFHDQRPGAHGCDEPARSAHHGLDLARAREAGDDVATIARDLRGCGANFGPGRREPGAGLRIDVADEHAMAGGDEPTRHRTAHLADADKADVHLGNSYVAASVSGARPGGLIRRPPAAFSPRTAGLPPPAACGAAARSPRRPAAASRAVAPRAG